MAKVHKQSLLRGTIKTAKNTGITVQLSVYLFEEDEYTIAFCPALDLSGYGANEEQATGDLQAVLTEYFLYTTQKKTIREDLQNLGWVVKKSMHKKMLPPSEEQILKTNENFSHILKTFPVRKVNTPVVIPAFA